MSNEEPKTKKKPSVRETALRVAKLLLETNFFATTRDGKEIFVYNEEKGVYEKVGESFIKEQVERYVPYEASRHLCSEVEGRIERRTYIDRRKFDSDPNIINLQNGLFDLRTQKLSKHDPRHLSRIQLPFSFDPSRKAPRFSKFLSEVQPEEKTREYLLEVMAYCFFPDCSLETAFIFNGSGNNGKTVFLRVLEALLGNDNVSNMSLQALASDKFSEAGLDGKLANIYYDLASEDIRTTGKLKNIISGEWLDVRTIYGRPFKMRSRAKLIASCNKVPDASNDKTDAWFRRWRIIDWVVKFGVGEKNAADKQLDKKLTTSDELSGVFNMILPRLQRLQEKQGFTIEPTIEQLRRAYTTRADVEQTFIDTEVERDLDWAESSRDVYEEYWRYCHERNLVAKSPKSFTPDFAAKSGATYSKIVKYGKRRFEDQSWAWLGVRLKNVNRSVESAFAE